MKLVTFQTAGAPRLGAMMQDEAVLDLTATAPQDPRFASLQALIEAGERTWDQARELIAGGSAGPVLARSDVRLLAPLPQPVRLRDCSLFLEHMEKALLRMARTLAEAQPDPEAAYREMLASGRYDLKPIFREQVLYYNANHLAVIAPEADLAWPSKSDWMDYELEWACVIGRGGSDISAADARSHIFGYTIFNDWSARDIQIPIMDAQLGPGEGKDFANGLGPCVATVDEFADPYALTMTARVNGEEWSRGSTGSMQHSFEDAIVQFAREKQIHPGEVIGSGTVLSGCGFELGRRLAAGDLVELEIDGIGVLRNRIAQR